MRNKWLLLGLVFSVAINIGVLGSAGYRIIKKSCAGRCAPEVSDSSLGRLTKELGLSPAQEKEIKTLRESQEPQINKFRNNLKEKRAILVDRLSEPDFERDKLDTLIGEIESLQAELQKLAINQMLKEKSILTPEQQKKFFSLISLRLCPEEGHTMSGMSAMFVRGGGSCLK